MSPRGSAALLRLAIQKLCAALEEKGKNIAELGMALLQTITGVGPRFRGSVALGFQTLSVAAVGCSVPHVGEHRSHSKRAGVRSEDFV